MVREGATVIDISANLRPDESGRSVVGDVDFDAVDGHVGAITPVPGGVGPLTMSMLFRNVVQTTRDQE